MQVMCIYVQTTCTDMNVSWPHRLNVWNTTTILSGNFIILFDTLNVSTAQLKKGLHMLKKFKCEASVNKQACKTSTLQQHINSKGEATKW